jgi:hypothetical protein
MTATPLDLDKYLFSDIDVEYGADEAHESFSPVSLDGVVSGTSAQPKPDMLEVEDPAGPRCLLYRGMVNGIHGDSGAGKSWLVMFLLAERIRAGEVVMLVDLEDTIESTVARLKQLGLTAPQILGGLCLVRPDAPFGGPEVGSLLVLIADRQISTVVIDSLGEAFGLEGINENNDSEVNPWLRAVARRLADSGPAVLLVDHLTKSGDNNLHASGSKRKRAAIGGASYLIEATKPLVRGIGGSLKITCAKDRHGRYRKGEVVGSLEMEFDLATESTSLRLRAVDGRASTTRSLESHIVDVLTAAGGAMGMSDVRAGLRAGGVRIGSYPAFKKAVDEMIARGELVENLGPRNSRRLHLPV